MKSLGRSCISKGRWLALCVMAIGCHAPRPARVAHGSPGAPCGSLQTEPCEEGTAEAGYSAPGKHLPGVLSTCEKYATLKHGRYEFMNNVFGAERAQGFEQCLLRRERSGKTELGWTWAWPASDAHGFAFPEVVFGWKPWSPKSTYAKLPVRLEDIESLRLRYAVETEKTGRASLAVGMWMTNSNQANPTTIVTETVIWLDSPEDAKPPGERVAALQVEGADYELWHDPNHGDRGNGQGWDTYYFKRRSRHDGSPRRGTCKLHAFLQTLSKREAIRDDWFLASVEFGEEALSGRGTTWVRDFEVSLDKRDLAGKRVKRDP
ncbi:MAG TPA: hypothetical protein VFQ61_05385 [Polyangiaceae bacterium]|nr:hypothetical protein [Polyangiaceae bacterium]